AKKTTFAIIDAGMTELIRPALYQAYHQIDNLTGEGEERTYDIVGPICETSDAFLRGIQMRNLERGDLVAIRSSGAYGEVMTSTYNLRDKAKAYYSTIRPFAE
ncbi:MAG: diaminopimelate decarboxylase, partial [Cyclobacteriaceae bacterium]